MDDEKDKLCMQEGSQDTLSTNATFIFTVIFTLNEPTLYTIDILIFKSSIRKSWH
jgi:hypothetical protein